MKAQQIVDYIFEIAPNPTWANENIFEFGDGDTAVEAVGVAWWINTVMLRDFAAKGITLGLSHERVFYNVPDWYHWGTPCRADELAANQRMTELLDAHGIAIHRFHSNLDLVDWGMPAALIDELGWSSCEADWSRGVPVVTIPGTTLSELIADVKEKLQLPFIRYDGDPERRVERVAVAWGGLCQGWTAAACAAPLGFDVLLGGDIIDGVVRLAREQGWAVIDAMHHATELEALRRLVPRLQARFPSLDVHYYENTMPWAVA
ncbi:MAG: Nif3-like dinuclear metal center hexameric protein [Phycisphaeraceae bacterium]